MPSSAIRPIRTLSTQRYLRLPSALTAIEVLAVVNQDGSVNGPNHPAAAGSILTIYAAGFGLTDPLSLDGEINGTNPAALVFGPAVVTFGDTAADILFAGPAPGQVAGITQINVRVPQLAPDNYDVFVGPANVYDFDRTTVSVGR